MKTPTDSSPWVLSFEAIAPFEICCNRGEKMLNFSLMGQAWNNWYHCITSTYGTWLRGDPRGWRSRHHREHCEGDYRAPPPPDAHADLYDLSKHLMTRDAVHIEDDSIQNVVLNEFVSRLLQEHLDVLVASFDDHHLHVLVRLPDDRARHWIGLAKKHTSLWLRQQNLQVSEEGGIWGKRCTVEPIQDRSHQLNATLYILDHEDRGAKIWALPVVRTSEALKQLRERREAKRRAQKP